MTNLQITKCFSVDLNLGHLDFGYYLDIGAWNLVIYHGGPYWTRTSDSLLKRQILYRLS